jgi:hypothetical protein
MRRVAFSFLLGIASVFACTSKTTPQSPNVEGADAGDAGDAGADAGDTVDACAPPATIACSWDASPYPDDAAVGQCRAKHYSLTCKFPNGVTAGCLSDDPTSGCADVELHVETGGPAVCCENQCAPNEYAVGCAGDATNTPSGCRSIPMNSPGGPSPATHYALFCCACP